MPEPGVSVAADPALRAEPLHYSPDLLRSLQDMVVRALPRWSLSLRTQVALLNVSENATFDLQDSEAGRRLIVRVYRDGYRNPAEIRSELAWIEALRRDAIVPTHAPVCGADGDFVQTLTDGGGAIARRAVAFGYVPGREPDPAGDLVGWFRALGGICGRMHAHSRRWRRPAAFQRNGWTFDTMLGSRPLWGAWRAGLGLDATGRRLVQQAVDLIERRLALFGSQPERFGLIHADLRLANLLVDGDALTVIDFDDCGFGWFAYDFAAAVSFMEHEPVVPELMEAWVAGYRGVAPLDPQTEAELPVFVMLRRILLMAWIASHAETPTAQALGVPYSEATLVMAERFLQRFG